jgi:hypothetical protein
LSSTFVGAKGDFEVRAAQVDLHPLDAASQADIGSREDAKARRKEVWLRRGLVLRQAQFEGNEMFKNSGLIATFVFDFRTMGEAKWFVVRAAHVDVLPPNSIGSCFPKNLKR